MAVKDTILGKPLASSEESKEELSVITGVPVLGLDALASTGYGPEAALTILAPLGVLGLHYFPIIAVAVVVNLTTLYLSYQQTAEAYPAGGGAYNVAKDNLGIQFGLWAAIALMIDYLLNVAVGIAAGVGAVVSAVPGLHSHTLALCLGVLGTLTLINLRGVRESGLTFVIPVFVFVGCMAGAIVVGLIHALKMGGHPHPLVAPPPLAPTAGAISTWIVLTAFANGCTAMTGIEAVSNGVPLFREPKVPHAHRTLTVIFVVLGAFLLALGYLCPAYHIGAMDEQKPGYQTILSQLLAAVAGRGVFYYIASASVFIVLTYSAQTSFADFPRVCRLLAQDNFLPPYFATRGRRLVFSEGVLILALLSAVLLIAFRGVTEKLIPLFAVGAFAAFLFSQAGMVVHWRRQGSREVRTKLICNAVGAAITAIALSIIVAAKFVEGAWMTIIVIPGLVLAFNRIKHHYREVEKQVEEPLAFQASKPHSPAVIVPIDQWNRAAEKALRFGMLLSGNITALHVSAEGDTAEELKKIWNQKIESPARRAGSPIPRLEIVESPYRQILQPILDFVERVERQEPERLVVMIIPELVEPHWYQALLHNFHARRLRSKIYRRGDGRTIVVNTPWFIRE